jgi:hypothetical protein
VLKRVKKVPQIVIIQQLRSSDPLPRRTHARQKFLEIRLNTGRIRRLVERNEDDDLAAMLCMQ